MGTTRNIFKWVFANIAPGETDAEKRVDADRIMDNFYDVRDMVAPVEARGANAEDGNANGNSTASQCNLTLRTANGEAGLLELGDFVQVYDGANKWYLQNNLADDELSFSDADLAEGAGPSDYAAPAFLASLVIDIVKFRPKIGKGDIILSGSHADKLTGDDIEAAADDATALGAKLGALQSRVDVALDEAGAIKDEAVDNATLAKAALLAESFENIIWGQFDADFDNDGLANGWLKFNTPTCEMDEGVRKIGSRSQKVVASQPQDGVYARPYAYNYADYLGDYVAFSAWVFAGADDSVVLEIHDGVSTTTAPAGGVAGTWVRLGLEHQVDGAASDLQFRIYADGAATFYVDGAMAKRGRLHPGYVANGVETMRTFMVGEDYANWVLNGDFREWTNGTTSVPDFWQTGVAGFNSPTAVSRDTTNYMFGDAAMKLTLALGEGVFYEVPNYVDFRGQVVYVSGYFLGLAGANEIRLELDDGVSPQYIDFAPDAGEMRRPGFAFVVDAAAAMLRVSISNQDGGSVEFVAEGLMLARGMFPLAFKQAAHPSPLRWDFALPGPTVLGLMFHEGANLDVFPVPCDCVIHKVLAYEAGAPGAGPDTFTVTQNGVATALAAAVATGQQTAMAHNLVPFAKGDRLQVTVMTSAMPGSDAGVAVEGYRLGY